MKRIGNELDSVHFSLKKASQMVKEIGRQVLPRFLALKCLFFFVTPTWLNLQKKKNISGCY
jgi:novel plant SNARE